MANTHEPVIKSDTTTINDKNIRIRYWNTSWFARIQGKQYANMYAKTKYLAGDFFL